MFAYCAFCGCVFCLLRMCVVGCRVFVHVHVLDKRLKWKGNKGTPGPVELAPLYP